MSEFSNLVRGAAKFVVHPRSELRRIRLNRGILYRLPECDGGIYLYPDDNVSAAIQANAFELATRRLLRDVLRPGMTVIDAGANLGLYTVMAGKCVGASGRVYAFEPSRREWRRVRRSVRANRLRNVRLLRAALSDHDGVAMLSVCSRERSAYNTIGEVMHPDAVEYVSHEEEVKCVTLDSFVRRNKIARVDVIKIDVEGAEELVLRGGRELLSRDDAPLLVAELSDRCAPGLQSSAARVLEVLRTYGYEVYVIEGGQEYTLTRKQHTGQVDYEEILAVKARHVPWLAAKLDSGIAAGERA